jgi:heptaprenyl diphosphate synthase
VNPSVPLARRNNTLSSSLGLAEKLFSSTDEKRFAISVEAGLDAVEIGLLREMSFADNLADVTSRYLLDAGGKRVRPTLTLLTAQLGNGNSEEVIRAAEVVEITHLASLYHDDVMDEAQMRRGVPSAQAVWGNSVAILTGDLLFARASKLVADLGVRAIKLQADTFERLCLGQLHETIGPRGDEDPIEHYIQVLSDKTGSLIALAATMGVIFSQAPESYATAVEEFGEKIGVAFQLIDDVIDLSPRSEDTGKLAGTDLRAGVATLPLLYLRELAVTDADAALLLARLETDGGSRFSALSDGESAVDAPLAAIREVDDADLTAAIAELRDHAVTARTLEEAHRWAREAVAALAPLPNGPVKKALTRFADTVVERSN